MKIRYNLIFALLFIGIVVSSCEKDKPKKPVDPQPTLPTQEQLIADSIYLFSKEIYFWQDIIGTSSYASFNPRQYVVKDDALKTAENVIAAIRNYNVEDKTHRFSYAEEYQSGEASAKASVYYENDYGISIKAGWKSRTVKPSNVADFDGWYISFCYPSSPAGLAGIKRGMKILKIDGVIMGYTNAAVDKINDLILQNVKNASIELVGGIGDTLKTTISTAKYIPNSFFKSDTVLSTGGKKVGYFMYRFFDDKENSESALNTIFTKFKSQNIDDIILDLRCNNGGYVSSQNILANFLAPAVVNNQIMYQTHFNNNLQTGNYTVFKNRYSDYRTFTLNSNTTLFKSANSLNLPRVYIIVSSRSASASELLINNLKSSDVLGNKVVVIGDANTYGKPVGFFPIDLFKKVSFWTVSFFTKNKNEEAVPYLGFSPNYVVYDGVDKEFGDPAEDCVKAALTLIDGGTLSAAKNNGTVIRSATNSLSSKIKDAPSKFDNMIFSR